MTPKRLTAPLGGQEVAWAAVALVAAGPAGASWAEAANKEGITGGRGATKAAETAGTGTDR